MTLLLLLLALSASAAPLVILNPPSTAGNPCNTRNNGLFPDVAVLGGKIWCAVEAEGQLQVVEMGEDLKVLRTFKRPLTPGLAFPRLSVSGGVVYVAYRDGSTGMLWTPVAGTAPESLGLVYGNDPVATGGPYLAYQGLPNFGILRRQVAGGSAVGMGPGRPTGLSRILPSGKVTLVDDERVISIGTRPCYADGLTVVEGPDGGNVLEQGGRRAILWPGQITFTPRCASGGGVFVVATWGKSETRMYAWRTLPEGETPVDAPFGWLSPSPGLTARLSGAAKLEGFLRDPAKAAGVDILVNLRKIGEAKISGSRWTYDFDTTPFSGGINLSALLRLKDGTTARDTIRAELSNAGGAPVPLADPRPSGLSAPPSGTPSVTSAAPARSSSSPAPAAVKSKPKPIPTGGAAANDDETEEAPPAAVPEPEEED